MSLHIATISMEVRPYQSVVSFVTDEDLHGRNVLLILKLSLRTCKLINITLVYSEQDKICLLNSA